MKKAEQKRNIKTVEGKEHYRVIFSDGKDDHEWGTYDNLKEAQEQEKLCKEKLEKSTYKQYVDTVRIERVIDEDSSDLEA